MKSWKGSAGICLNEQNEMLLVKGFDADQWAVPSGGIEEGESPEGCCVREIKEETGYDVHVVEQLKIKETTIKGIEVKTYYFKVEKVSESSGINDPDQLIEVADWKSKSDIKELKHVYPEDVDFLLKQFD